MEEPDDNQAFIHNVCKKTAQLTRVAADFQDAHFDQAMLIKNLQKHYFQLYDSVIEQTRKNAQDAFNALVKYRKAQIEDSCHEYGLQYKQIKSDFARILNEKSTQLNNISREAKLCHRNVKEMTRDSILLAKSVLSTADEVEKSLNAQARCQTPTLNIDNKQDLIEIRKKISDEKKRHQKVTNDIKELYKSQALEFKNKVRAILVKEIQKRKPYFSNVTDKLKQLQNDITILHDDYMKSLEEAKIFEKEAYNKREQVMNLTNLEVKEIGDEIKKIKVSIQTENKTSTERLANARKILKNGRASQSAIIREISKIVDRQRDDSRDLERSIAQRRKERLEQLASQETGLMQQHKTELQMKLSEISLQRQIIDERQLTTDHLREKSRNLVDMFMNDLREFSSTFDKSLQKMEFDINSLFNTEKMKYGQMNDDQYNGLNSSFTSIYEESRHHRKEVRKSSHKMKKDLTELKAKITTDGEERERTNNIKREEYENKFKEIMAERRSQKEERCKSMSNKHSQKDDQAFITFQNDLSAKRDEIQKNNKIPEMTYTLTYEETEFKHEKDTLEATLDIISRQIESMQNNKEIRMAELASDVVNADKNKRMLERQLKTARDEINQEYELTLQVDQVQLADKIDKISLLYNADENERGREVIEAIRRVKQTENRTKEIVKRKMDEHNAKMKEIHNQMNQIKERIRKLSTGEDENVLKQKLVDMQKEQTQKLQDVEVSYNKLKQYFRQLFKQIENDFQKQKDEIKASEEQDLAQFKEGENHYQLKHEKLRQETDEKKQEIEEKFSEKKQEIEVEHQKLIENMKRRIESAQRNFEEYNEDMNKKYTEFQKKCDEEYDNSMENLPPRMQTQINELIDQNKDLHSKMEELNQKVSDLRYEYFTNETRVVDKNKINTLKKESETKITEIAEAFKPLFGLKMRRYTHPVFYRTVATNTDTDPIPRSAWDVGKPTPLGERPSTGAHRSKASIVFPRSARMSADNLNMLQ
ncbi:hypothetical protein TVAG_238640 [Trichomonas vaginalis G3]|uniref:Uncharacterized protein n=1 Tax=Trichomonas vaginalis (strain ATCC PRA-98 / G3) TaxID=412133 RepID=A2DG96_TRIV3|nr:biological adhesion protein [Trichomonas vaginalis G3]EAY20492.1 hypothetical protein TVAG_238640 [Trichomonas vaginalis G3]KAI5488339.1 biological adhesion protein [Trichomonas vaginalis G3]|eukprot:XP_001581478.1 hypothetical protein [Trichomonas vaginalis G3]